MWLSHSIVEFGRGRGCPFKKVERPASWVRTPALKLLQKIPTHSRAGLLVFSSSNSSLWRRPHILISGLIIFSSKESPSLILPHILFKPVPSAEQASASEIFVNPFQGFPHISSRGLALLRTCHTLFKPVPGARQASTSLKVDKFFSRIFSTFSSSCYSCSKRSELQV